MRALLVLVVLARVAYANPEEARALYRSAELYAKTAQFEKAAVAFEAYAKRYGAEADALVGLATAIAYRRALGQREQERRDITLAQEIGKPRDAAEIMLDHARTLEGDALVQHLESYLKKLGDRGGPERTMIVHAKLGVALWQRSCSVATHAGLCVRRAPAHPDACTKNEQWLAVPRDRARVQRAMASLEKAIDMFDRTPMRGDPEALAAYAEAKLALADHEFEALVALKIPKLTFRTRGASQRSQKRFGVWLNKQTKRGGALVERYMKLRQLDHPAATVASSARIGQVSLRFASTFLASQPPRDVLQEPFVREKRDAYCTSILDHTQAMEQSAAHAFGDCLAHANSLLVFEPWHRVCEREIERLEPELFPRFRERVAAPSLVGRVEIALEGEPE